ncbi:MAG: NADH-quinone oxidoreductase subunit NuoG [Thermaerobacter sp.]|nr:NADH-quinone oxidoreductase subunit NuoG [Thermaerobacter sp.]
MITLTIDGREAQVPPGTLILDAAKQVGIEIPIFCYHPRMDPAAACRMCLVRVEKMPKLQPACATPVSEGMVVSTDTDEVQTAHAGVLEFLLANHPLDCPICDKGGECDLQNNSIRYGPQATRFADPKRHLDKARPLGPIVELDQERCIQCTRCVRFMDEVAGDPVLTIHDRGGHAVIDTAEGRTFDSVFSGNTIEICPVGALTSRPFRFKARPWDLDEVDSVCPHCPVGCNIRLSVRHGEVKRILSRDNEEIDWGWLCDRGRFGYGFLSHGTRLEQPMLRKEGRLVPVSWDEAIAVLKERMQGGKSGALGGGRHSLEAAYLLRRFVQDAGIKNVDHRVLPLYTAIAPGPVGRIDDVNDADLVISLDAELLEEAPVLALRLRQFERKRGLRIVSVSPREGLLDMPHQEAQTPDIAATLRAIAQGEGDLGQAFLSAQKVLFIWNGQSESVFSALDAAVKARSGETATLVVGSLANSFGAQAAGLLPQDGGLDARGMLEAAAAGQFDTLLVFGHDILSEFPDAELAAQAIEKVPFLAVAGTVPSETTERADLVLPVAAWAESDGHFVNMEGRAQRYYAGSDRGVNVVDDWELMARLLGIEADYDRILAEVQAALAPLFGKERRQGAQAPTGGYRPAEGAAIAAASIYYKGVTPDPFLNSLIPGARVAVAADVAAQAGVAEGEEVEVGGYRAELHEDPGLPPGAVLVRAGQDGANRALGRAAAVRALAGRSE